jgi:hypothetical protein
VRNPFPFALVASVGVLFVSFSAHAFDKQTYLGGGFGVSNYDRGQSIGPTASLYGAYGINDSFDGRLELMSSLLKPDGGSSRSLLNSALLAVTYKLDVIQWIPWAGLGVGVHQMSDGLSGPKRNHFEPGLSILFGLDYAWSRKYGLSLAFGLHALPFTEDSNVAALRYTTSVLRFERRWGW